MLLTLTIRALSKQPSFDGTWDGLVKSAEELFTGCLGEGGGLACLGQGPSRSEFPPPCPPVAPMATDASAEEPAAGMHLDAPAGARCEGQGPASESASSSSGPPPGKGKGKGKGRAILRAPVPRAESDPRPKAKPLTFKTKADDDACNSLVEHLEKRTEKRFAKIDGEHSLEPGQLDLSGCDPTIVRETFVCPRCEKEILVSERASHFVAHSSEIRPWLFLGSKNSANNGKELTVRTGITHIINVAQEVGQDHVAREEWQEYNAGRGAPHEYHKFEWYDRPEQDIIAEMAGPLQCIHAAHMENPEHRVLVHCVQGISRSASVVVCYLMVHEKMSLREAYDHLKASRPVSEPRREFLEQLGRYECQLFGLQAPTLSAEEVYRGKTVLNVD